MLSEIYEDDIAAGYHAEARLCAERILVGIRGPATAEHVVTPEPYLTRIETIPLRVVRVEEECGSG